MTSDQTKKKRRIPGFWLDAAKKNAAKPWQRIPGGKKTASLKLPGLPKKKRRQVALVGMD